MRQGKHFREGPRWLQIKCGANPATGKLIITLIIHYINLVNTIRVDALSKETTINFVEYDEAYLPWFSEIKWNFYQCSVRWKVTICISCLARMRMLLFLSTSATPRNRRLPKRRCEETVTRYNYVSDSWQTRTQHSC